MVSEKMPTLADLQEKYGKNKDSQNISAAVKNIKTQKEAQHSSFVGMRNISHTPTTSITEDNTIDICQTCNKRYKITQDKSMNKDSIIDWFTKYLTENEQNFTLDWLMGQKLTFESVNEMRK